MSIQLDLFDFLSNGIPLKATKCHFAQIMNNFVSVIYFRIMSGFLQSCMHLCLSLQFLGETLFEKLQHFYQLICQKGSVQFYLK